MRKIQHTFIFIKTIARQWLKTKFDRGYYTQNVAGSTIYLSARADFVTEDQVRHVAKKYFFRAYEPSEGDTIVDIGASFGHEIALIRERLGNKVRYFAIEPQPRVFDCLARSLQGFGDNYFALITPISSDSDDFRVEGKESKQLTPSYSVPVSRQGKGARIPTVTFKEFLKKYSIHQIDLCKINIEGEERNLLPNLDLKTIKRLLVSAHDFRAQKGEGESFRTREFVRNFLSGQGMKVVSLYESGKGYDFLYAEWEKTNNS